MDLGQTNENKDGTHKDPLGRRGNSSVLLSF